VVNLVQREGFLKAFGHDHLISPSTFSGLVQYNGDELEKSLVMLVVETNSLAVFDPGESEKDRKDVGSTMLGEKVLDAARFPQIRFASSSVRSAVQKGDTTEIQLKGTLSLHGTAKTVTLPVRLQANGSSLRARGEISLLQSDYGITPIKVAGGMVRVKDKLKIVFDIVALEANSQVHDQPGEGDDRVIHQ
jgi:polyisoprenoid-binding protein YceI